MLNELAPDTVVWLNPDLLSNAAQPDWSARGLTVQVLPEQFDANKEKSVIAALDYVEQHSNDPDILIEYP